MAQGPGPVMRAWYEFRMTRFPWRKKWLAGYDLQGNTFWESKDQLHAVRTRRIAKYSRTTHYGDVKVSPSWMQWLRHSRFDPPTLAEQRQDVARQERLKLLASQADAAWASKPSALDAPDKQQPIQPLQSHHAGTRLTQTSANEQEMPRHPPVPAASDPARPSKKRREPKDNPWTQAEASKDWQPQAWSPPRARRG